MTLTETRPEPAAAAPAPAADERSEPWLVSADHKRLGLMFMAVAGLALLSGVVAGELMRIRQSSSGSTLLGDSFFRTYSVHATLLGVMFLGPLWIGISTYVVPLQIGSSRLALPRLHAFALWLYVVGTGVAVAGWFVDSPAAFGLTSATPPLAPAGHANKAVILVIAGMFLVALGMLMAALDLAVTILKLRTAGLTFDRLPMFTTATFATAIISLLSTPVFLAGLVLLYYDQRAGGHFFNAANAGGQDVWQHALWLFGRPDIYLLTLPGLGAACDIVATHARKPLLSLTAARGALCMFGFLSLTAWAAGSQSSKSVVLPTYTIATAAIAAPIGILALLWLGTLATGRTRVHVSLFFVLGALGLWALGAVNAAVVASRHLTAADSAWTAAHVHVVAFGPPTLLAVGAIYHWGPKMLGRHLSAAGGGLVFLLLFGGFAINGLGTYLVGYRHGGAAVREYANRSLTTYSVVAAIGGALVLAGVLVVVLDLLRAAGGSGRRAAEDPYEGLTLEWATPSPPPPYNFNSVPEVRSAHPLLDLRAAAGAEEVSS